MIAGMAGYFIFAFSEAFAPNYTTFIVLRFIMSIFSSMAYLSTYVLGKYLDKIEKHSIIIKHNIICYEDP